jgi:Tfp pilus assembly protein PilO
MLSDFRVQKRVIIAGLVVLIGADVALAAYRWNMGGSSGDRAADLARQDRELKLSQADIDRARKIKDSMPAIQADCDKFEHMLFPASTGYSSVTAELDSIAQKAGAQVQDLNFKQAEVPQRGLTSVEITSIVSGTYSSVVHFVNGVQRSPNIYLLDSLSLASDSQNPGAGAAIKVTLHLQTYFRTAS